MNPYQITVTIAGTFCALVVGYGIWAGIKTRPNPTPAPAGLLAAAPAAQLTFAKIVLAVITGNFVFALTVGLIYLLLRAK